MHVLRAAVSFRRGSLPRRWRFDFIRGFGCYGRMRQRGPAHPAKPIFRAVVVPAMSTVYVHSFQHSVKLLMAESLMALERSRPDRKAIPAEVSITLRLRPRLYV